MKRINWNILIFTCLLCLMPMCLGLFFYTELPEQMPIHFNVNNEVDNWASKNFVVFGLPIIMAMLQAFCCIVSDVSETKKGNNPKFVKVMKWLVPILTILLYILTILVGLGKEMDVGKYVTIVLGIMFIVMGNYMPKMSYENSKQYIKIVPKSEKNFMQMIRVLGYTYIIGGIFMIAALFVSNLAACIIILGLCVLVFVESLYFSLKNS